jgi:uncharacterized membrane protein
LPLSKTFTVPVGKTVDIVDVTSETTTSILTDWPVVLGLGDAMINVFVSFLLTICDNGPPLLPPKLASPG